MIVHTVTRSGILQSLRAADIANGDTIMCHSSLSSFGQVDGGADALIDALIEAVGSKGHVVMPTLTATFAGNHGDASGKVFNPVSTPSRVGKVTDVFWRRPNAIRSHHPTHSVACIGPHAAVWMSGHEKGSTFSWDTAYGNYVHASGGPSKLVFLGVTMACSTTLHAVEDWLRLPYLTTSKALVESNGLITEVVVTKAPHGCRGFYKASDRHHQGMEQTGLIRRTTCGTATISVIDTRACIAETIRQELETPGSLLCLRPNCRFCIEGRSRILLDQKEIRARANEIKLRSLCC